MTKRKFMLIRKVMIVIFCVVFFCSGKLPLSFAGLQIITEESVDVEESVTLYSTFSSGDGSEYIRVALVSNGYQIEYNAPVAESYVGLLLTPQGISGGGADISGYESFTFRVKGQTANIPLKIEIQNASPAAGGAWRRQRGRGIAAELGTR